ncbi:MAG: hypothetical protein ACE5Q3_14795, partial [Alphaproteobacteria bacterium]
MNAFSIGWSPLLPPEVLAALGVAAVLVMALGLFRRAPGLGWRAVAIVALLVALGSPSLVVEEREPLSDIAVVVVDETPSQEIGDRRQRTDDALETIRGRLDGREDIELRVVRVGSGGDATSPTGPPAEGTRLFGALERALADVPRRRFAGAILITDGQVHDAPEAADKLDVGGPVHALITGNRESGDRRLTVVASPGFGIVGQEARLTVRIDDLPEAGGGTARVSLRRNGADDGDSRTIPVGRDHTLSVPIDRGGASVFEISVEAGPQELTLANNKAVVTVNGVRDRLRVLLVSGRPHPGERTWRNLLKADPAVDLVHFTILRPPNKQDGTPVRELSLIAFPIRELFEIKLHEFDLIIFDNYQRLGVLPQFYLGNIADYVSGGGALLEAVGPGSASPFSLYRTPLAEVLPGEPTGNIFEEGFHADVTEKGRRHPVTAALPNAGDAQDRSPEWGRWFRHIEVVHRSGTVLMNGARERPLLILDRIDEGRVAQLMSDQIWLWARGYEGGGPHAELLRRLAHWLMKEPELEEDALHAEAHGTTLNVVRRSLAPDDRPVEVTFPSGRVESVVLEDLGDGRASASLGVDEAGLYELTDGERTALTAVGSLNPVEFRDVAATERILEPVSTATGGGIVWLAEAGTPEVRRLARDRSMFGPAIGISRPWIGLQKNGDFVVRGVSELPLLPGLAILIVALGSLLLAWRREG